MYRASRFSVSLVVAFLVTVALTVANESLFSDASRPLVRLHILADSDGAADQLLKLAVRDRLLDEVRARCDGQTSPDQFLIDRPDWVRAIAEDELRRRGCDDSVSVEYGRFAFPAKTYGSYYFPAGIYDGMRVVIGSGRGRNWWCVMYPPLCFTGEAAQASPDDARRLAESADLYVAQDQVIVRPKLKIKEWWDRLFD